MLALPSVQLITIVDVLAVPSNTKKSMRGRLLMPCAQHVETRSIIDHIPSSHRITWKAQRGLGGLLRGAGIEDVPSPLKSMGFP